MDGYDYYTQTFHGNYKNLLALLKGSDDRLHDELLPVSAHFDHVGYGTRSNSRGSMDTMHNGADDNASGVAVLLEVIEALIHTGYQPRRSILFAFWDGEENGLLGSRHWIRNPTMPLAHLARIFHAFRRERSTGTDTQRWSGCGCKATGVWVRNILFLREHTQIAAPYTVNAAPQT